MHTNLSELQDRPFQTKTESLGNIVTLEEIRMSKLLYQEKKSVGVGTSLLNNLLRKDRQCSCGSLEKLDFCISVGPSIRNVISRQAKQTISHSNGFHWQAYYEVSSEYMPMLLYTFKNSVGGVPQLHFLVFLFLQQIYRVSLLLLWTDEKTKPK